MATAVPPGGARLELLKRILDGSVAEVTVLPMRFGAVLSDEHAVVTELLQANHDEFVAAPRQLDGRQEIKGTDPVATRDARIRLGEIIGEAIEVKREDDTRLVGERMDEQRPVRAATSVLSARCCRRSERHAPQPKRRVSAWPRGGCYGPRPWLAR